MKITPLALFIGTALILSILFLTLPINLFDGEYTYKVGLQEFTTEAPLSLSYFVGMGLNEGDLDNVLDFHLLPKGWMMVFIFIFGIPGILSYRWHMKQQKDLENGRVD